MTNTTVDHDVNFKRHHWHWGLMISLLAVGLIAVTGFELGGGKVRLVDGTAIVTEPTLGELSNELNKHVTFIAADGTKKEVIVQEAAAPNGQFATTTDGFGPDGKLQRNLTQSDRYDPIDRLGAQLEKSTSMLSDAINKTNQSVATVSGQVQAVAGDLSSVKTDVASLGTRVTALEKQPVVVAPAPAPAPTVAPAIKDVPVTDASPAPAADANQQVAAADTEVVVPKGFHVSSMGDTANQAKAHTCAGKVVPDMSATPKITGQKDSMGKLIKFYPNHCVAS